MQQGPNIYQIKFEPDLPEDVLIAADVDGMEQRICGEDIYPYWEYIYENEGGFVETDGRYILCVLHTAGMQGGVVMFWDTAEEELVHVSDGAYCVAAVLYEGEVYTLQLVEHFMTEPHFAVSKVPFGTMDCFAETDPVEWDIPVDMETFSGQTDDIKLAACLSARNAAADAVIEAGKNKSTECAMHSVLFAVLKDDGPVEGSQYRITT